MSINDPVVLTWNGKRRKWNLIRGRETFYDENRYMREWDTIDQARQWAIENLHTDPIEHLPESARAPIGIHSNPKPRRRKPSKDDLPEAGRQPRLFGEEAELPDL